MLGQTLSQSALPPSDLLHGDKPLEKHVPSHDMQSLEDRARRYAHMAGMDADPATRTNGSRYRHNPFVDHPDVVQVLTLNWLLLIKPKFSCSTSVRSSPTHTGNLLATLVDILIHSFTDVVSHHKEFKHKQRSLYVGLSGAALTLLKVHLSDPGISMPGGRSLMDIITDMSLALIPSGYTSPVTRTVDVPDPYHVGLLDSTLGSLAVASRIALHVGNVEVSQATNDAILELTTRYAFLPRTSSEVLYGRAGLLAALQLIDAPSDVLVDIVEAIIEDGRRTSVQAGFNSVRCPLMWSWNDKMYLGAAHGAAGILTQLFKLPVGVIRPYLPEILPSLAFLGSLDGYPVHIHCSPSGEYYPVYGTRGSDDAEVVVQWCHGVVGYGLMWLAAWHTLGNNSQLIGTEIELDLPDEWLDRAKMCGEVTWQRGLLKKHVGLCHGVSGNAYLFLQLWSATGDLKWYHRALAFAGVASQWHGGRCDHPNSVYEGLGGLAWLLSDLIIVDRYLTAMRSVCSDGSTPSTLADRPWIEFPAFPAFNLDVKRTLANARRRVRTVSASNTESTKPNVGMALVSEELRETPYQ